MESWNVPLQSKSLWHSSPFCREKSEAPAEKATDSTGEELGEESETAAETVTEWAQPASGCLQSLFSDIGFSALPVKYLFFSY